MLLFRWTVFDHRNFVIYVHVSEIKLTISQFSKQYLFSRGIMAVIIIIISLLKNHMSDARAYIIRTSQMKHTNRVILIKNELKIGLSLNSSLMKSSEI